MTEPRSRPTRADRVKRGLPNERQRGRPKTEKGARPDRTTITWHSEEVEVIRTAAEKVGKKPITFVRDAALTAAKAINEEGPH